MERVNSTAAVTRVVIAALVGSVLLVGSVVFAVLKFGGGAVVGDTDLPVLEPAPTLAATPQPVRPATGQGASRSGGRTAVDPAWLARVSTAAGIPLPALRAYADAQLRLGTEQPGCHLGWNTLAGLGWIESHHGTIGGRTLLADGRSSSTILGPALDGAGPVAAIRSSAASARWHGDATWEHAVGPLQFLASTWDRWGADGDDDGSADPRDLDDAALAAGRYLCADGHDLATSAGWNAAVHSYNHDLAYVVNVADAANTYASRAR